MEIISSTRNQHNSKICRVCGDRAIGFNFNGLTCESCKSFFRRNANKYSFYKCRKTGTCQIDFVTRKCCTRCRLDKCFLIGMKTDLIYAKLRKINDSASSSSYLASNESDTTVWSDCISEVSTPSTSLQTIQNSMNNNKAQLFIDSDIRNKLFSFPEHFSNESVYQLEMKLPEPHCGIEFSLPEENYIHEICNANQIATFHNEKSLELIGEVTDLIYALNLSELYVRKTVKFCKNISAFKCMQQEDQLVMLKDFFIEVLLTRLAFAFDADKDGFSMILDEDKMQSVFIKLNVIYEARKQNFLYYCREKLFLANTELEDDATIRDLVLLKRLFQPRENISCPEYVRYQNHVYDRLLQRYLEQKYDDPTKAAEKIYKINEILNELSFGKNILESIFVECDSSQLTMILNELIEYWACSGAIRN